jgi:Tfp pilus assembly protein PilO
MIKSLKFFWIVVAFIWSVALGVTYWNSTIIDAIGTARETNEKLRGELNFYHRNAGKLNQMAHTRQSFLLPVASVALGLVELKSRLHSLAAAFNLEQVNIKDEISQSAENRVPVAISAHGSIDMVLTFLTSLQKYPYLQISHTSIKTIAQDGDVELTILLFLQFEYVAREESESNQLQVNSHYPYQGEKHL